MKTNKAPGRVGWWALSCVIVAIALAVAVFATFRPDAPLREAAQQALPQPVTVAEQIAAAVAAPDLPSAHASTRVSSKAFQPDAPLSYSGLRLTGGEDPHAYGPRVELCRNGSQWTGFIAMYTGSVADPSAARLEPLLLDERTGVVSFTAELSEGLETSPDGWMPARRLYRFSGHVDANAISGALTKQSIGPGQSTPVAEQIVLKRETSSTVEMSCQEWASFWGGRTASPRKVVSDILDLMRSALADEVTRQLDEIERPIMGLHHVQRHALAVLEDDGSNPGRLAASYIEIINALVTTSNGAATVAGRRPGLQLPPLKFQQLAAAMRARSTELATVLMPVSEIKSGSTSTVHHAALTALDLAQAALSSEPRFTPSWLPTHLKTVERASQSVASDDGTPSDAMTMKLHLLRSALGVAIRQANEIAGRANVAANARSKAAELAVSLRSVVDQLD